MFERFTDRARKVMQLANQEAQHFDHEYIGTEHILLGLVKEDSGVAANVLKNLDVDPRKVKHEIELIIQVGPGARPVVLGKLPHTPRAKKVIEFSIEEAQGLGHNYVGTEHLLLGLMREEEGVAAQVLMNLNVKLSDVREEVLSLLGHVHDAAPSKVEAKVITPIRPKTPALDVLSTDLTELARRGELGPLIGREAEFRMLCEVLACRGRVNPLLVGEPGVGKTALVAGLAQAIVANKVPDWLQGRRVVELSLSRLWGNAHDWSQMSEQVRAVFAEVRRASDTILFLPHLVHSLRTTDRGSAADYVHSELFLTLRDGKSPCIIAASHDELRTCLERHAMLEHYSQPILFRPASLEETVGLLSEIHERYSSHHGVRITKEVLTEIGESADRHLPGALPGKAILLLDRSAAKARMNVYEQSPNKRVEVLKIDEQITLLNFQKEEFIIAHDFSRVAELHDQVKELQIERERLLKEFAVPAAVIDVVVVKEALRELIANPAGQ